MIQPGDKVKAKAGGWDGVGEVHEIVGAGAIVKAKSSTMGKSWWITLISNLEKIDDAPKDS